MTTDLGGWTRIVSWDRQFAGDGIAEFEAAMDVLDNSMTQYTDSAPGYLQYADVDLTSDVLIAQHATAVPNGGELLWGVHYYGWSQECSAAYFFVRDSAGDDHDLACKTDVYCGASSHGPDDYTADELAWLPGYTCADSAAASWTWDFTDQADVGVEIVSFHLHGFQWDALGDYARLYWLEAWVR